MPTIAEKFTIRLLLSWAAIVLCLPAAGIGQPLDAGAPREVSVSAQADVRAAADAAQITMRVFADGKTAVEAQQKVKAVSGEISRALQGLGLTSPLAERGRQFLSGANPKVFTPLTRSATIGWEKFYTLTTTELDRVPQIIDALLAAGADSVVEVRFVPPAEGEHSQLALREAAARAQAKASELAAALNMELGAPISAVANEEPVGAGLREQLQQGEYQRAYDEYRTTLYLTVRYELLPK